MQTRLGCSILATWILLVAVPQVVIAQEDGESPDSAQQSLHFVKNVLPVFRDKCFACHGDDADDIRGEFDMRSRDSLIYGGESGQEGMVPFEPENSPIYLAATRESGEWAEMPPKENDQLSNEQLESIRKWIEDGATWPDESTITQIQKELDAEWSTADGTRVHTSGGLSDEWTNRRYDPANLWAYQPLRRDWDDVESLDKNHPIDVFLKARYLGTGVDPAPLVDRRTLIRRATFDLIGLPPTPEEIARFLADERPDEDAFADVVDRLLDSPHYGEQWGRHWLDVVRYADSSGFANDFERGNAWRYRDYVIRAFNEDKPYDQFVREQIAGDELDSSNPEFLIASGFLRMGPWELTGMEVARVARQRFLDDVTDAVGQVFLGHMLQCARCHDHKFDPIPTRDYYSFQAFFSTTQLAERSVRFLEQENVSGFEERQYLMKRKQYYQAELARVNKKRTVAAARQWYEDEGYDSREFEEIVRRLAGDSGDDSKVSIDRVRQELAKTEIDPAHIPPRHVGFTPEDYGIERVCRKGLQRLVWQMDRYQPFALSVYSGVTPRRGSVSAPIRVPADPMKQGDLEQTCILTGGDPFSRSTPVTPSVLSAVMYQSLAEDADASLSHKDHPIPEFGKTRTELADWIADADNPLTARVMVNRIWLWHFGQGIAGNPNNFGATGRKPTHPELLDFLASRFIESNWSIKDMHRLIMSSEAYRRSTKHPQMASVEESDPNSELYLVFQPRRLAAEELRDAMLYVTEELNPSLGGIPVRPEINLEAALQPRQVMGTFAEAWQPNPRPEQRHRRSIYALRLRGLRDPFLEVFNAPSLDLSCEARESSTVTPQVFSLFNSANTFERGLAMARLSMTNAESDEEVIGLVFMSCYGRLPDAPELAACLAHWKTMTARHETLTFEPFEYPTEVVREAVEENTGEKFTFVEPLESYEDFVPDFSAHEADAKTRGLAELCLVLFNSNEFVYVY